MLNTESGLLVAVMASVCCAPRSREVNTDKLHGLCVLWAIGPLGVLSCIHPHRRALSHQTVCQLSSWIFRGCASPYWLQLLPEDQEIFSMFGNSWFLKWGLTVLFLPILTLCRSYPVHFRGEERKIEMKQTVCRRNASCWDKHLGIYVGIYQVNLVLYRWISWIRAAWTGRL